MHQSQSAPYGSWKSPISAETISVAKGRINEPQFSNGVVWLEQRPLEGGRYVLTQREPDGTYRDVTPAPFNVRTRVHEYGGGSYLAVGDVIYFVNYADQRIYRQHADGEIQPMTPAAQMRYANFAFDAQNERLYCVREDHSQAGEPVNELAVLDTAGGADGGTVIATGHDFYASPCLSPDGSQLAWLTWDHPNMPWDGTELWVSAVQADGSLGAITKVAGGDTESIFQPQWSPDGVLHFVSDRTGWWNLYRWQTGAAVPLCRMAAEFGLPQWVFGRSTYGFQSAETIVCTYIENGTSRLATLDTPTGTLRPIDAPFTEIDYVRVQNGQAIFAAGSPTQGTAIWSLDVATAQLTLVSPPPDDALDPTYISQPEAIAFPTANGLTAHAFFYPPHNPHYQPQADEKPPLIVLSHGGPTSLSYAVLKPKIQYWTSRGIGIVDVNYGGSTGYGTAYRRRLNKQWGIVDSADCINAARYLVARGDADGERLVIKGGSAGGYTTLSALTFHDFFTAGSSHYGVSDLETLAQDTHKFESRYLDSLIGAYPAEQNIYIERSPIHYVDQLACPLIIFQGLEDRVVPPSQAENMFAAVREKQLPVAYLPFAGEQHGFRQSTTIKQVHEAELYFFSRVFDFTPADELQPITIENL